MPLNYLTCEKNGAIEMRHNNNNAVIKVMKKIGGFYDWPRTDDILPYPFEDITKTLHPPHPVSTGGQYSFCWTTPLKLKFTQYPAIHTNYSLSNCTITSKKDFNRSSDFLVIN